MPRDCSTWRNTKLRIPLMVIVAIIISILLLSYTIRPGSATTTKFKLSEEILDLAGLRKTSIRNSTLGFEKINAMVLPHRSDQLDILALLGWTYGLDIDIVDGVYTKDLKILAKSPWEDEEGLWKNLKSLVNGPSACWRAHANLWRKMLKNRWSTMLVLEGDADFVANIHEEMDSLSDGIAQLQSKLSGMKLAKYDNNDPYYSKSWDMLQLGWCTEGTKTVENGTVVYQSNTTIPGESMHPGWWTHLIYADNHLSMDNLLRKKQKILHLSLSSSCTVGYALSAQGAAKLLHRSTRVYQGPVDVQIGFMSSALELITFSPVPALFFQRKYVAGQGQDSDMHYSENITQQHKAEAPMAKRAWRNGKFHIPDGIVDYDAVLDANIGVDGDNDTWEIAPNMIDRSATMGMSVALWPERTTKGPPEERKWMLEAQRQRKIEEDVIAAAEKA